MTIYYKNALNSFRIAAAMAAALCGLEVAGLGLAQESFSFLELARALAVGLAVSLVYALVQGAVLLWFSPVRAAATKFNSLGGSLGLLFLILGLWIKDQAFAKGPPWLFAVALVFLAAILIILGRVFWTHLNYGDPDLAMVRFQALAPVGVLAAAAYSVASHSITRLSYLTAVALGVILIALSLQYLAIRFIWARKRVRFAKWGLRVQYLALVLVIATAGLGAFREYRVKHRPATADEDSPSAVLITVDTWRGDYVSANNPKAAPTPALDALARDGINFPRAFAPSSWTEPSVAAIIAGRYASACGAGELFFNPPFPDASGPLAEAQTVGEAFQAAGYTTAAFVEQGWLAPSRGFNRGFGTWVRMGGEEYRFHFLIDRGFLLLRRKLRPVPPEPGAKLTDSALAWLRERPRGPFFLWLHYFDPHLPYLAHAKYPIHTRPRDIVANLPNAYNPDFIRSELYNLAPRDKEFIRERYEGEVRFMDDELNRVFAELKRQGLYDSTLIAVTSDHGEEFWDHGGFEHGHSFHQEVIGVPLILKLPANLYAGKIAQQWVSAAWLTPTMLKAAEVPNNQSPVDLLACLADPNCGLPPPDRWWFSEKALCGHEQAAIGDLIGHKAILHGDSAITCYNLANDPTEKTPFPEASCPWPKGPGPRELFRDLEAKNHQTFILLGGLKATFKPANRQEMERLRALGYIP